MPNWDPAATKAWAAGMRSEKKNSLNATQQTALRAKVNAWADGLANQPEHFKKTFELGASPQGGKFKVIVTAQAGTVTDVVFG